MPSDPRCTGQRAVGPCTNRVKFEVVAHPIDGPNGHRDDESYWTCGVHAMQRVKWALSRRDLYYNGVVVNRVEGF